MLTREDIYRELCAGLQELFEVPPEKLRPEARLFEDLDLDSIDAVDLVVKLQAMVGRRIHPDEFRAARTIGDVVDCVERLLREPTDAGTDRDANHLA